MSKRYLRYNKKAWLTLALALLSVVFLALMIKIGSEAERLFDRGRLGGVNDYYSTYYGYGETARPMYYLDGTWYAQKNGVETVLLIGVDKYTSGLQTNESNRNTQQSDFLMVLLVDHAEKRVSALHINRDTMANIRVLDVNGNPINTFVGQLALSHTYGSGKEDSCRNVVYSVSDYLYGLRINHYAAFGMDAVPIVNDAVGGVTVKILDDLTPVDPSFVQGQEMTLHGNQALTYIRARGNLDNSTNTERMKRQRQYMSALFAQAQEKLCADSSFALQTTLDLSPYMVSDYSLNQMLDLFNAIKEYSFEGIRTIDGEAKPGKEYMEFYTDEDALRGLVIELFYDPTDE